MNLIKQTIDSIKKAWTGYDVPKSWPINWFQLGRTAPAMDWDRFGPIRACISVLSQEISRIPPRHVRAMPAGGIEIITTSAAARVFRRPNSYQTRSDFMLGLMRALLLDGNAYAYAERNNRAEVDALWPLNPRNVMPYLEPESGEIYYQIGDDEWSQAGAVDPDRMVPARNMLHVRMETPVHPLVGESPLVAAELAAMTGSAIQRNSAAFFSNNSQPDGYLRVPGKLDKDTAERLQERWMQSHSGEKVGRIAVLGAEAEYKAITMTATDAEVVNQYRLSVEEVARIFRVPPFLLGNLEHSTISNVETLTRIFINSGLGFYVDHLEESLTRLFRLPSNERIEFDVESALLRSDLQTRMDAYSKGVQAGVYSPNEVRRREALPPVEYGDEPRVQQQLVPLSFGVEQANAEPEPPPAEDEMERASKVVYMTLRRHVQ